MAQSLKDKTVLVTGAASGIGRKLAHDLYWDEKCRLILVDVDAEALGVLKDELEPEGEGDRVAAFVCDIGSEEAVARLARESGKAPLDVLVNNAGIARLGAFENTDFSVFERVVQVTSSARRGSRKAFLPRLLQSREGSS